MIRLFLIVSIFLIGVASRLQSIAVKGRITCGEKPVSHSEVELWDEDVGFFDSDDLLGKGRSNLTGHFYLTGSTDEYTEIDPYMIIYHYCEDEKEGAKNEVKFTLPSKYIYDGQTPSRSLDFGVIDLGAIRQCRMLQS
ncbi:Transthyretin-like [Parelaphostrongylus tenuis]|uniref:Transthyretin-like n=1 Tax=Parelaphostrongylus tenuis TaxID=148309 RepID=A0AAD5QM38_PARTN|nr:Transthyretin-like [Parelaphostrongylus tenuis]